MTVGNLIVSGNGISGGAIETTVSRIEGSGGDNGISIVNSQSLTIGGIDAGTVGLTANDGNLNVQANGAVVIEENVNSTNGDVLIKAIDGAGLSESLTLNAGTNVTSGGNVSLLAGDDITLQATSTVTAGGTIDIAGDAMDADVGTGATITVAAQLTSTGTTITGGNDDDHYNFTYPAGVTNSGTVTINEPGFEGTDNVVINGSSGDDELFLTPINATSEMVTRGNATDEPVVIPATIEGVTLLGGEGNDTFNVNGSALWPVTVDGGNPGFGAIGVPPGDTLITSNTGSFFDIFSKTINEPGSQGLHIANIETLELLPVTTSSLKFDLNDSFTLPGTVFASGGTGQTATQAGFTGVTADTLYATSTLGYGWNAAASDYHGSLATGVGLNDLINDGHVFYPTSGASTPTFIADVANGWAMVTVTYGKDSAPMDGVQIFDGDTGTLLASNL